MTTENYRYRTSPLFLRNQFLGKGQWKIPNVPKCTLTAEELDGLRLIGYDRAKNGNDKHFQRMVHFFLYDYKFEDIWADPKKRMETLKKYRAILTPDFSMYLEMHPVLQLYNTFRNRWVGAYLANQKIKVIPTVNWGDESTFDFCFEGIAKGSAVAVSTYMAHAHSTCTEQKEWFLKGYNEMLRRIEPEVIICYHTPFPEMQGNIVYVDYELSSWKHDKDDLAKAHETEPSEGIRIVKRTGYVMLDDVFTKGGGSAFGGEWRPSKAEDERFLGKPGDIINSTAGKGYERDTWIGEDGRAFMERHYTDHNQPWAHSDPHDHLVPWDADRGNPLPGEPINYPGGDFPTNFSYHLKKGEGTSMRRIRFEERNTPEENRFKTISEFKWCIHDGGEVAFDWNGKSYGVFPKVKPTPDSETMILIGEDDKEETCRYYTTIEELLEHPVDGVKLREIITQVEVTDRMI